MYDMLVVYTYIWGVRSIQTSRGDHGKQECDGIPRERVLTDKVVLY